MATASQTPHAVANGTGMASAIRVRDAQANTKPLPRTPQGQAVLSRTKDSNGKGASPSKLVEAPRDPKRTQQLDALVKANATRTVQAALKREIHEQPEAESRQMGATLLEARDERLESMRLGALLRSVRGIGTHYAVMMVRKAGARSLDRRCAELTDRQARELAAMLRDPRLLAPNSRKPDVSKDRAA